MHFHQIPLNIRQILAFGVQFFYAFLEGSFLAKCPQNLVIFIVFGMFDIDLVKKWFLQHSVGLPSAARGVQKPILTNVCRNRKQIVLRRSHLEWRSRAKNGIEQRPSKGRVTAKQPPSNRRASTSRTPTPS